MEKQQRKTDREVLRENGCPSFVLNMMDDEECTAMRVVKHPEYDEQD